MKHIIRLFAIILTSTAGGEMAEAQQPGKLRRIGFLGGSSGSAYSSFIEAFRQGLRELGWVEGQDIAIEYRYAGGKIDRLPDLAAELVRLGPDVIAVSGARAIRELKNATKTIPVIMTTVEDPVAQGFVASLARPGGNITGLTNIAPELSGKRLELLKDSLPKMSRLAILWQSDAPGPVVTFKETEVVAKAVGLEIQSLEIQGRKPDLDGAFLLATKGRADALIVLQSVLTNTHRKQIVNLAARGFTGDVYAERVCGGWRPDVLRPELHRDIPPRGDLRRQNPQSLKSSGSPR